MTIAELIARLQTLPPDCEVALLGAGGFARPPTIERVKPHAGWDAPGHRYGGGFIDARRAFLIRPEREIIG